MSGRRRTKKNSGFQLVEDIFNTAKCLPMGTWVLYYAFTFPFVLGLLYFWSDMSNHAFANTRLPAGATFLTFLFLMAKTGHALFSRQVTMQISGNDEAPVMAPFKLAFNQLILHSTGLIVLPIALVFLLPFGRVYAFYQNFSVIDDGQRPLREVIRESIGHAGWQSKQNHVMVWLLCPYIVMAVVLFMYLLLPVMQSFTPEAVHGILFFYSFIILILMVLLCPFGMIVALNLGLSLIMLPRLANMLFGLDTVFIISPSGMMGPTFYVIVVGMTYLCLDPLIKIGYCIRCFYSSALDSGKDLRLKLDWLIRAAAVVLLVAVSIPFYSPHSVGAQEVEPQISQQDAVSLDSAIEETFKDRKFAWRIPREQPEINEAGFLAFMSNATNSVMEKIKSAFKKIRDWFTPEASPIESEGSSESSSPITTRSLVTILIVILLLALLYTGWKTWKTTSVVEVEAIVAEAVLPDLEDETTTAEALPANEWMRLAQELLSQGQTRLAMRAYFFAGLSQLAGRRFIQLAPHKSNRDYARELFIIAHAHGDLLSRYTLNLTTFESVWYGDHSISEVSLKEYIQSQEGLGHHD